jgi:murein DD-endopeptidase MepM/ murein hydrolase activator NlpD
VPGELRRLAADARQLIIPVDGVALADLRDSWHAPRADGRLHEGVDIMAPLGTPVRASMAGRIAKLFVSKRGGNTIYEFDPSGRLIFYYAHLNGYAPNLTQGDAVVQGQLIGYVGKTGNATVTHLHFEIQHTDAGHHWWRGAAFNPYLALKAGSAP